MLSAALLLAVLASPAPAGGFYAPPADAGAGLPEEGIFPRGRRLAFMGYSGDPERDLAAGFTAAGPVYTGEDAYLRRAFERGWPVVAHVGGRRASVEAVAARVRALAAHPEVLWWAVRPEEARPWRADEMRYLAAVSSAVRVNDPARRPVYHYNPSHRDAEELAAVAPHVDILAKGAYANDAGFKRDRAWVRRAVEAELAALRKAGRPGAIALVMPELSLDPPPEEDVEIPAWARHDVYLGLVAGAKGVLIWSLFKRPEVRRTWSLWYDAYARCARELGAGLGAVFLFGERRADLAVTASRDVSSAELAHGTSRWLFVVNSSSAPASVAVMGWPEASAAEDAFLGAALSLPASGPLTLPLPPYGVAGLRLTGDGPGATLTP